MISGGCKEAGKELSGEEEDEDIVCVALADVQNEADIQDEGESHTWKYMSLAHWRMKIRKVTPPTMTQQTNIYSKGCPALRTGVVG